MTLGKHIQERVRSKGIGDKAIADSLHVSVRSVPNVYSAKEIPTSRVATFSILLDEDVYFDYYKDAEGIGPIVRRKVEDLSEKIKALENIIFEKERLIQNQAELIESLRSSK